MFMCDHNFLARLIGGIQEIRREFVSLRLWNLVQPSIEPDNVRLIVVYHLFKRRQPELLQPLFLRHITIEQPKHRIF